MNKRDIFELSLWRVTPQTQTRTGTHTAQMIWALL